LSTALYTPFWEIVKVPNRILAVARHLLKEEIKDIASDAALAAWAPAGVPFLVAYHRKR
jgi:hypothetical protein